MQRPDQAKFEEFVQPLLRFDPIWEMHANQGDYVLEKNPLRQPGRILRRGSREHPGNPSAIVCLALDPVWHQIDFQDDLPYSLFVRAYFEGPGPDFALFEFEKELVAGRPLSQIGGQLSGLLDTALAVANDATAEFIMQHGRQVENLRRRYEQGGDRKQQ